MKVIEQFLQEDFIVEPASQEVTYEQYCLILDNLNNPIILEGFRDVVARLLTRFVRDAKGVISRISKDTKLSFGEVAKSFREKSTFGMIKAFGFNIRLMFRAINEFAGLVRRGLLSIFQEIEKTGAFKKIRKGVMKVDELLNRYPLLKRVTGIVVAGLLLFIWLNMTFVGHFEFDFDFSNIVAALAGTFSLAEFFVSAEGMLLFTLFATGVVFGISVPWLGKNLYNLILALVYTANKKLKETGILDKIKRKIKKMRMK